MDFQTVCVLGLLNSLCPWSNSLCPWAFKQFVSLVFQTVCVLGLSNSLCPWSFKQCVSLGFQTAGVHGLSNNLCPWSFKQFVSLVFQTVCVIGLSVCVPDLSNSLCHCSFEQCVSLVFQAAGVHSLSNNLCPWSFKQFVSLVFQTVCVLGLSVCVHGLLNNLCPWSFKQFVKNKKTVAMHKTSTHTHTNSLQTFPKMKEPIDQQQFKSTCPAACEYDINQRNYFFMKKLCPHLFMSSSFFYSFFLCDLSANEIALTFCQPCPNKIITPLAFCMSILPHP